MAGKPSNATFAEGIKGVLGQVAELSVLPDADLQFCLAIQAMITQHLRQGLSQAFGGNLSPDAGGPGPINPQQGGAPPGMYTGGAMPGLAVDPANMDELRRTLGNTGRAA